MTSITEIFDDSKHLLDSIEYFVNRYIGGVLLRKCGITKVVDSVKERGEYVYPDSPLTRLIGDPKESRFLEKCVSARQLLIDKILLCFHIASAYLMFKTDTFYGGYRKDTFYRFDLMPKANWERLQLEAARNLILDMESQTSREHLRALVFDDSLYARTGGKGTDLCAKVFDHNDRKMRTGYRMMTGGWTNGESFVPFSQTLLTTRDEKLMVGVDGPVDRRTVRGRRRARAKEKGTDTVQRMVLEAKGAGIPFDLVLFDTWFSSPSQLVALKGSGADVIAMVKKGSTKYTWENPATGEARRLDVKEIYSRNKKRRGRSRYLLAVEVAVSDKAGREIPAKLVYARNHSKRKDWVCFVCTDVSMDEEQILRAYTMRWSIETYFKVSKSYLKLRTECHSTSYDALTSHMVVVAIRYMILVCDRFRSTDSRTLEEFFYRVQREVIDDMVDCAIILVIDAMLESVRQHFGATEEQVEGLVRTFISKLPEKWASRFHMPEVSSPASLTAQI